MNNINISATFSSIDSAERCLYKIKENVSGILDTELSPIPNHDEEPQTQINNFNALIPMAFMSVATPSMPAIPIAGIDVMGMGNQNAGKTSQYDDQQCDLKITAIQDAQNDIEKFIINGGGYEMSTSRSN